MMQTTAYAINPFIFSGNREHSEAYRAQQLQRQIRAFITCEGKVSAIYGTNPARITDQLCSAVNTITGKHYGPTAQELHRAWNDLEQVVLKWQSPYGEGWKA